MRQKLIIVLTCTAAALAVAFIALRHRDAAAATPGDATSSSSPSTAAPTAARAPLAPPLAGPAPATAPPASAGAPGTAPSPSPAILDFGGRATPVAPDNAATRAVAEAAATRSHAERLSLDMPAPPFDAAAYARDPDAYCALSVPARCFQAAQPAKQVPVLTTAGANFHRIAQDGACDLAVRAAPGAPVSFTSLDLGSFANGLTAITVRADDHGVAHATFSAGPGTINDVHVLAGCPLASGQVRFVVDVTPSALVKRAGG